jgi:FtsH-binding integral membrane protein
MPTTVQFRRGTTAQNNAFTGANGEISVDTTDGRLVVHDGSTAGGSRQALASETIFRVIADDSTGIYLQGGTDELRISGGNGISTSTDSGGSLTISLDGNITTVNTISSADSTSVTIADNANIEGTLQVNSTITSVGNITTEGSFVIGSASINETDFEKIDGITNGTVAASKAVVVDSDKDASGFRNVTVTGSFIIGSADINETDLEKIDGITNGAGAANKALVLDASANVASGLADLTASGTITAAGFTIGSAAINEAELETIDGVTAGTVAASKAVVVDSNKDAGTFRNITASGTVEALTLTATGTLNANIIDAQIFQTSDSTAIQINEAANISGALFVGGAVNTNDAATFSGVVTSTGLTIGSAVINEADLEQIDDLTAGTVTASKALVVDSNKDISGLRNIIMTGNIEVGGNMTVSGTTTSVNTTNLEISDALIELNKNNSGGADVDAGLYIQRGSAGNNAALYWNEGDDKFKAVLTTSDADATSITDSSTATLVANLEGASANLSGTVTFGSLSDGAITVTAFVDEDNMASNSATLIPTQQSVKAYVDAEIAGVSGGDLTVVGDDSATFTLAVGTDTLQFSGGTNITTATSSSQIVTVNLDADITVDSVTAGSFVGPLTGTASQATVADTVKTISAGGTDAAFFVPMVDTQDSSSTAQTLVIDGGLTYNPSTNILDTTATAAQYADLAEVFPTDDLTLEPGDVVHFVGQNKVGKCNVDAHSSVAGVISTDPGFILNNASQGVKLAMTGRVPCKIQGIIEPGDLLVSAGNGRARAEANPSIGTVIGKAIEAHNSTDTGVINIMITLM